MTLLTTIPDSWFYIVWGIALVEAFTIGILIGRLKIVETEKKSGIMAIEKKRLDLLLSFEYLSKDNELSEYPTSFLYDK